MGLMSTTRFGAESKSLMHFQGLSEYQPTRFPALSTASFSAKLGPEKLGPCRELRNEMLTMETVVRLLNSANIARRHRLTFELGLQRRIVAFLITLGSHGYFLPYCGYQKADRVGWYPRKILMFCWF